VDVAFLAAYRRNAEEAIEYLTPYLSKALSTLPEGALRLRLANYVLDYLKVKNLHRIAPAILALDPKDRNPVLEILRSLRIAPADWGRFESALKADDDPTRTADPSAAPAFQQPGSWRAADSIDVKSADYQKLLKAIRSVHAGDIWAGRRLIAQLVERLDQQARASSSPRSRAGFTLTKREQEVINLVARGLTKKEVARKLGISDKTVKTHLSKVVSRLL
jgi:DNA-binding CsgD family transcriptional regulator